MQDESPHMLPADDFHALVKTVYAFTYPSFVRKVLRPALFEDATKLWEDELATDWVEWCGDEEAGRKCLVAFGRGSGAALGESGD
jgi:hypothetical protein